MIQNDTSGWITEVHGIELTLTYSKFNKCTAYHSIAWKFGMKHVWLWGMGVFGLEVRLSHLLAHFILFRVDSWSVSQMTSRAQGNIVVQACCCAILASFQVRLRQSCQKWSLIFDPSESVGVMSCVRAATLFQSKTISIFTWVPITFPAYPWKHTTQPQSENPHRTSSAFSW